MDLSVDEIILFTKAMETRSFEEIKAAVATTERERALQAEREKALRAAAAADLTLSETGQTLSTTKRTVFLNNLNYRLVKFLAVDNKAKAFTAAELANALGVSRAHGYSTKNYPAQLISKVRFTLRTLGYVGDYVIQLDNNKGTYRWNPACSVRLA